MHEKTYRQLIDLAWDDTQAADPAAIGMIMVTLYKDNDDLAIQVGSTAPPEIVRYALTQLVMGWRADDIVEMLPAKLRKAL